MDAPISLDWESHLVTQAEPVPRPVCLAVHWMGASDLIHFRDPACKRMVRSILEDTTLTISGFYSAFDMQIAAIWCDLLELVHAAYRASRVYDTMSRQKLIDIAHGCLRGEQVWTKTGPKFRRFDYGLDSVAPRYGVKVDKSSDTWRLRYAELDRTPISRFPQEARDYPLLDVSADAQIWQGQQEYVHYLADQHRVAYKSFCLARISANGIDTNKGMVDLYRAHTQATIDSCRDKLARKGFVTYKVAKKTGIGRYKREDKKLHVFARKWCTQNGIEMPETKTGRPSLAEEDIPKYRSKTVEAFHTFFAASTRMGRVNELDGGHSGLRIHTRFDELMKSGRTSSSAPNMQSRQTAPGDRECCESPDEQCQAHADFDGLELRTIAQFCIHTVGHSRLAEVLNAGEDPHLMVAANLIGLQYDEAKIRYAQGDPDVIDARGAGKAKMVNFSSWAGTTPKGLYYHSLEAGLPMTMEGAGELYQAFLDTWPEAREYFKWVRAQGPEIHTVTTFKSRRVTGGLTYTEACSIGSQGLGACATQAAKRALVYESECRRKSVLYGMEVINYVHDEFHMRLPDDRLAHDRAILMGEVMRDAANKWLPDVPTRAKPFLTYRWSKLAKPAYGPDGRLIPWDLDQIPPMQPSGKPWPADVERVRQWVYQTDRGRLAARSPHILGVEAAE